MSLDELISIERVELNATKERIRETYDITTLMLSKLFREILLELRRDIIPLLDVEILLFSLKSVPFTNEVKGLKLLESLKGCLVNELYRKSNEWTCKSFTIKLQELMSLILYDYIIDGSIIVYRSNPTEWDLRVSLI
ncbi:hypothetical protein LCGC14_1009000 [marine sediment metagenome]|uniref:Uncharacterized protein n=1 Tax=marine sediment metagenome TaxID=412755 RepID=A0A0F9NM68_9ZZZZ